MPLAHSGSVDGRPPTRRATWRGSWTVCGPRSTLHMLIATCARRYRWDGQRYILRRLSVDQVRDRIFKEEQ